MTVNDELERIWKETTHVSYCSTIHMDGEPGKSLFKRASSGKYSSGILRSFISETKIIHNWSCRKSGRFRTVSYTLRKPIIFTPPKEGKHTYCLV